MDDATVRGRLGGQVEPVASNERVGRIVARFVLIDTDERREVVVVVGAEGQGKHRGGLRHGSFIQGCTSPHLRREEVWPVKKINRMCVSEASPLWLSFSFVFSFSIVTFTSVIYLIYFRPT